MAESSHEVPVEAPYTQFIGIRTEGEQRHAHNLTVMMPRGSGEMS